ncbi:hypothetical protein D479_13967 [Halobacillus sp. BAB-2008]|nr:hypothetical protein D479_13967 [Halobacillus sp. BAB-2008]
MLFFGTHFVPQPDPYTAENVAIVFIYILWAVSYWLQFKVQTYKSIVFINVGLIVFLGFYVVFMYYPITFLELFLE